MVLTIIDVFVFYDARNVRLLVLIVRFRNNHEMILIENFICLQCLYQRIFMFIYDRYYIRK